MSVDPNPVHSRKEKSEMKGEALQLIPQRIVNAKIIRNKKGIRDYEKLFAPTD